MKVFKIAIKFEQNNIWSDRKVDNEGYLIKQREHDNIVIGYINALNSNNPSKVRYIKGLYSEGNELAFLQMCNDQKLGPICYVFPNIEEKGYWSDFNMKLGFFPISPGNPCSNGHATLSMEEVKDESRIKLSEEIVSIFHEQRVNATWVNEQLMADFQSLPDFLNKEIIFQMELHCGKW